jgi:hypothetical protein
MPGCTSRMVARHCRLGLFQPSPALTGASCTSRGPPGPIDHSWLRGEGSIPVPLPPPASSGQRFLRWDSIAKGPISVAISNSISGPPDSRIVLLLSYKPVSLRASGLR